MPVETVNYWIAIGTVLMQIGTVVLIALLFLRKRIPDLNDSAKFFERWALWFAFILTLGGIAVSLLYSEILHFAPCGLCWLQRVFLYPQALLFAIALWKRDRTVADYSIALSIAGGLVAIYQHYIQMGGTDVLPCPATIAEATDCAQRFFFEFGYITFPLVALSGFALLIVLMLYVRKAGDHQD